MNERAADAPDRCPRCGAAFSCGAAGPGPCACCGIELNPAVREQLRLRWPARCLCLDCLRALAADAGDASGAAGARGAAAAR